MVRLMPGKIKVKKTIIYKFTLKDLIFALILAILAIVILTKINVIAGIIYLIFSILLFIPIKDNFAYEEIFNILKFVFSKKKIKIKNISNIKSVAENKIEFSDGSFAKAIVICQKSFLFETEQNQNEDIDIFEEALKCIDSNVNFKICKIEKPIEINKQISTLKNKIDVEKNRIKKSILAKEYIELVNTQKNTFETKNEFFLVIYSKSIDELDRYISRIGQSLREANLDTYIASDVELNELISFSYLGNTTTALNEVLEKDIHIKSSNINLGEYKSATISISNMPKSVVNAWGRKICNIKNTFVCINVKQISIDTAINQIDNSISEMGIKQSLATKASDANMANLHIDSLNSLLTNIQNGTELVYNVEIHITSFNKSESELRQYIKNICKLEGMQINNNIFSQGSVIKYSRIENNSDNSKFVFGINSKTLAAIFPFVKPEINDENGVYIGKDADNQHVFLDIFKRSDIYQNSNGYVIGTPGSGKSFFLKKLVLLSFSNNTKIFILDPENEYTKLVNKLGGKVIDVGTSSYGCINPLQVFNIFTDSGINATNAQIFSSHLKTLENFYNLTLENTNEEIIELFNLLTIETYKEFNIDEHTQFNLLKNTDYPTFKDMLDCLEKNKDRLNFDDNQFKLLRIHLNKFVTGRYKDIWCGYSNIEVGENITCFSFQSLFSQKNSVVANAQMLLIFRYIEQEVINLRNINKGKEEKQNSLVICDEAHMYIDSKFPVALDFFYQMNKRIRKYFGSIFLGSQNISDFIQTEELRNKTSSIIKNSQYVFVFKMSDLDVQDMNKIFGTNNGFTDVEKENMRRLKLGQCVISSAHNKTSVVQIKADNCISKVFLEK